MPTMPIESSAPTRWNGAGMSGGMSVKRGWKPPALIRNVGLSPKMRAERELAGERDEDDARIAQHAVEPDLQRIEDDAAGEVDLETQQRERLVDQRRQLHDHLADEDDLARLDQHADARDDEARRAPAELEHRPDDEAAGLEREDRAQLVDDLRRVGDRVLREQEAVERAAREARRAACRRSTVCCTPSRPPMPVSVKPKPSWIGGNCAVMISSSDQPPGFLVESRPIALTPIAAILMSRMPPYSPRSGSNSRKPPPLTMPASIARPAPEGGLRSKRGAVHAGEQVVELELACRADRSSPRTARSRPGTSPRSRPRCCSGRRSSSPRRSGTGSGPGCSESSRAGSSP